MRDLGDLVRRGISSQEIQGRGKDLPPSPETLIPHNICNPNGLGFISRICMYMLLRVILSLLPDHPCALNPLLFARSASSPYSSSIMKNPKNVKRKGIET